MVKPKIIGESKEEKFKRIATLRTQKVLNNLRLLGNCSNNGAYSYTQEDIAKIFSVIDKEFKRVKTLYSKPKNFFKL